MKQFLVGTLVVAAVAIATLFITQKNDPDVIKIGWIGPLTGPSAVLGVDSAVAAQIAVDELNASGGINGKQVVLYQEDDQYTTAKSVSAYQKLVQTNGVRIIIMQTYGAFPALAEQAEKDGVLIFDSLDCDATLASLSENVFCLGFGSDDIATHLAAYADREGYKSVGVLFYISDTFMPHVKDVFIDTFDGQILVEGYSADVKDFRTSLLKMQARNIDALLLLGYDEAGIAMKQARELGINAQFLMPGTVTSPSLQESAGGHADGTVFTFWLASKETGVAKEFTDEFVSRQGRLPILDLATYPTYDVVNAIARALDTVSDDGATSLSNALTTIQNMTGVTGDVTIPLSRVSIIPKDVFMLIEGKPVLVE
jgi:branched-chain amino acid transport system substrate-binding protein